MSTRRRDSDSDQPRGTRPTHELQGSVPRESPTERLERAQLYIRTALNLVTADKAAELLSINTRDPGTTVDGLRVDGELIGLPDRDGTHLYPAFQLDHHRHRVHPVVAHANRALRANIDPYGAACWWLTATDILDGHFPLDDLTAGTLTVIAVDNILDFQRAGM